jgi:hypothetical protein
MKTSGVRAAATAAALAVAAAVVVEAGAEARAADLEGRVGVGAEVNLSGLGGLQLNRWFGESLRLGLLAGYQRFSYVDASSGTMIETPAANRVLFEVQGFYSLGGDDLSHLGILVGAGADLVLTKGLIAFGGLVEVGLGAEVLLSEYFAIHGSAGLGLNFTSGLVVNGVLIPGAESRYLINANLGIGPNLSAGFTWYFDKPKPTKKHKKKKKVKDEDEDEGDEGDEGDEVDSDDSDKGSDEAVTGDDGDKGDGDKGVDKDKKKKKKKPDEGDEGDKGDKGDKGDDEGDGKGD